MKYIINQETLERLRANDNKEWKVLIDNVINLVHRFTKEGETKLISDLYFCVMNNFKGGDILSYFRQYVYHRQLNEIKRQKRFVSCNDINISDSTNDFYYRNYIINLQKRINNIKLKEEKKRMCQAFIRLRLMGYKLHEIADMFQCHVMKVKHISTMLKKELNSLIC